ncbi:DHH family phosphoesterase [Halalkalibacter krulwichiae]|uniref:DHH family phosphoesterase n=1 Tax=Halalkalibacter krulwichiae TaxID=199441 RepID=UPI000826C464|nr:DHHA1 domain-containing protein [Halalkalibacter krulwichiae]
MTYHLYSHNDLDGVSCGILAKLAYGESAEVRYNSVQGLDFQVERFLEQKKPDDALIITDLSVHTENEIRLEEFFKKGGYIQLLDHHKTALHFNDYKWATVKVEYEDGRLASASSILYDYLQEKNVLKRTEALDLFIDLVRQWDTWEWDKNQTINAKRLNDLFYMLSIEEFEERMMERLQKDEPFSFDNFEEKILDMEDSKIERYIHRKRRELIQIDIDNHCVGVVHAESYHSELGNVIGKDTPHLDYIAILNVGGRKISYRTIHDHIDVSEIAKQYGGGGHAKAAGSAITEEAFKLFIINAFPLVPLRIDAPRNQKNLKKANGGSLYTDHGDHYYLIYPEATDRWILKKDKETINSYQTFEEAERHLKRTFQAWLVRDDVYEKYIKQKA